MEVIGQYNPRTEPRTLELKTERVKYWLEQGAQPSETVHRLLHSEGLIDREPPKRHTVPSRAEREAAAAAEATATEAAAATEATAATEAAAAAEAAAGDSDGDSGSGGGDAPSPDAPPADAAAGSE